jgi:subtilisin family serine protease
LVVAAVEPASGASLRHPGPPRNGSAEKDDVPGQYIVVLDPNIDFEALRDLPIWKRLKLDASLHYPSDKAMFPRFDIESLSEALKKKVRRYWGAVLIEFHGSLVGFSAILSKRAARWIGLIPGAVVVPNKYVRLPPDELVQAEPYQRDAGLRDRQGEGALIAASDPPLGLDRIDQRIAYNFGYTNRGRGAGVHVYVIDTGIFSTHQEFEDPSGAHTRVLSGTGWGRGFSAFTGDQRTEDFVGHGTQVAGIIGGNTTGVASGVVLHPVRVFLNTTVTTVDAVIAGVKWVRDDHDRAPNQPAVANLSLASEDPQLVVTPGQHTAFSVLEDEIRKTITSGVTFVIAAGNGNGDACKISPARLDFSLPSGTDVALTVGSINPKDDTRSFSKEGKCVDLFAPGASTKVPDIGDRQRFSYRSGTSMATPHVTGVAAIYLERNPNALTSQVHNAILRAATHGDFNGWCGIGQRSDPLTPDILLHWGSGSDDGTKDGPAVHPLPGARTCYAIQTPARPPDGTISATGAATPQVQMAPPDADLRTSRNGNSTPK